MIEFLSGIYAAMFLVAGTFFLKFWTRTRDRFLVLFGIACWLFAIERVPLAFLPPMSEPYTSVYLIRLLAFLLIFIAIVDTNRLRPKR